MIELWPLTGLNEICESIVDCVNKTAPVADGVTPYKMLRTTNVRNGYVDTINCRFVSGDTFERWTRREVPRKGDVILTREAPLGEVGMLRDDETVFLGQRLMSYRANPLKLDANFLLYSLMGPELQAQIRAAGSGATVEHIRVPDAERLKIRLPDLTTQQRVGSILASYDELYLNNRRRIAILEEMARRLFVDWFVRFRFPGTDDIPLNETEIGTAPVEWPTVRADEIIDFDPRTKVPKEGMKRFVPMDALDTSSSVISYWETRAGNAGSKFQNGDTLFARITPCLENGKTGLVNFLNAKETAFGSTEFTVMRGKGAPSSFVYLLARSESFRAVAIKSMGGADGRQRVRVDALKGYELPLPPAELLRKFAEVAEPLLEHVRVLADQNVRLRAARDLLLPKLISGEIDVATAEEAFVEAAE
ncbi:restriction endonuclease subunit S [Devosia sp.]|uniref:restriction endonuclease subunit S n=1 Tax=Devosia sp. TaxID=1871048 RepID=UPI001AD39C3A|nr:restriction endonuclease subunit S [Devosia sp.]MBN9336011.1 restriction endonuclease subunit S [Devosia sp.]